MTDKEKQDIINVIKETLQAELGTNINIYETKKNLTRLYRTIESIRPYLCHNTGCKNREKCNF